MNGALTPETDVVCQYCGNQTFTMHRCQEKNRIIMICSTCHGEVAVTSQWFFFKELKEHSRKQAFLKAN